MTQQPTRPQTQQPVPPRPTQPPRWAAQPAQPRWVGNFTLSGPRPQTAIRVIDKAKNVAIALLAIIIVGLLVSLSREMVQVATLRAQVPAATHAASKPAGKPSDHALVAAFNDGWTDGQRDTADTLGHRLPNTVEVKELVACRHAGLTGCHLEWDRVPGAYEAIGRRPHHSPAVPAACKRVRLSDRAACVALWHRPARTVTNPDGSSYTDPAGPVLVAECLSQYTGTELSACLRQSAN